jgi:murein L,D-transpeptidase YcbB/YkuD
VRQRPGPGNALGALRFNMPNPEAIFLHDTPSKGLFAQETRSFSHGCIRVENPFDLAAVLLGADWPRDRIEAKQADGISTAIPLAKPMPIFLLYLTAARGADDSIVYVKDVYRRDPALLRALDAPLPETAP